MMMPLLPLHITPMRLLICRFGTTPALLGDEKLQARL